MLTLDFFESPHALSRRAFDILDLKLSVLSFSFHFFLKRIEFIFFLPYSRFRINLELINLVFKRLFKSF